MPYIHPKTNNIVDMIGAAGDLGGIPFRLFTGPIIRTSIKYRVFICRRHFMTNHMSRLAYDITGDRVTTRVRPVLDMSFDEASPTRSSYNDMPVRLTNGFHPKILTKKRAVGTAGHAALGSKTALWTLVRWDSNDIFGGYTVVMQQHNEQSRTRLSAWHRITGHHDQAYASLHAVHTNRQQAAQQRIHPQTPVPLPLHRKQQNALTQPPPR